MEEKEDKFEHYECLGSKICKIFGVKINTKEDAIKSADYLVEYSTYILGILFAGNVVEILFGHTPYFGIVSILFFGFLTFCFNKWHSRIATMIYFMFLLVVILDLSILIHIKEFHSIWKYEAILVIPLCIVSWKMLRSSFLIHKKDGNNSCPDSEKYTN